MTNVRRKQIRSMTVLVALSLMFVSALSQSSDARRNSRRNSPLEAGGVQETIALKLTGKSIPASELIKIIRGEIDKVVYRRPGADWEFQAVPQRVVGAPLAEGVEKTYVFPIKIFGRGYVAVKANVTVVARNFVIEDMDEAGSIFVSNSPESVDRAGVLLEGAIESFSPARFLVHHKNISGKRIDFILSIRNKSDTAASLHVLSGPAGNTKNELMAGHRSSSEFFDKLMSRRGDFISIPPKKSLAFFRVSAEPGNVVSWIGEFKLLNGAKLDFTFSALYPWQADFAYPGAFSIDENGRPHGVFPINDIEKIDKFILGGRWLYVQVGERAVDSHDGNDKLYGNYGLLHHIDVEAMNPSKNTEKLFIYLRPSAGPAAASLLVNNERVEVPVAKNMELKLVKSIPIAPGETKKLKVQLIPESGSNYPLQIVFGSHNFEVYGKTKNAQKDG